MRVRTLTGAAVAGLIAALALPSTPAGADIRNSHMYAQNKACDGTGGFTFGLYYNSGFNGAVRYFRYDEYDFGYLGRETGVDYYTASFCEWGNGAGTEVKNNAASAWNARTDLAAQVYFNKGYQGIADYIGRGNGRNLSATYNDNASFKHVS
ncbi:hypothetical protein [Streptomyces sp. TBY4]|uniref:hypothetical protein n=1 Tax=Streptomyces sp. TBY4 TaxID=2962030 RepID=UPI0020B866EC|nr:hypothetical protein [Streptomyces sp. TBY4]MCP3754329.1 hypothetical protein [Streptomyces sp. TBY4]